jgi:dTMP kinase
VWRGGSRVRRAALRKWKRQKLQRDAGCWWCSRELTGWGKVRRSARFERPAEGAGKELVCSREPTAGPWGRRLRESATLGRLAPEEELELFIRDRRQHVEELLAPALDRGAVVLLDRYYLSTAAYQGARGADPEAVLARNEAFAPVPDLVLLLDCDPLVSLERVRRRGGVVDEFEKLEELQAVRSIFLSLRRPFIRLVDANRPTEVVGAECAEAVRALLGRCHS